MLDQENTGDTEGGETVAGFDESTKPTNPRDVLPEHADDAAAVDAFLSGFGRGYQVSINRTAPVWCSGYLTTLPLDHGITLSEIRESYGGRRFQLRILDSSGRFVAVRTVLISDVPRDDGKPLASLDRAPSPEAPRANPSPPVASGFHELADVFREVLALQQAAADRQVAMLERLIGQPVAQVHAAVMSPLEQIQQLGEVISAVRELSPASAPATDAAEGGGGEAVMMKLAEKLIGKWGDKKEAAPHAGAPGAIRHAGPRPPGVPGARRSPIVVRPARPPAIASPLPTAKPPAPFRAVESEDTPTAEEEIGQTRESTIETPTPNPATSSSTVNDSSIPEDGNVDDSSISASSENAPGGGEEYTAEDVRDLLEGMPVDHAAAVMRDVFDKLSPEEKDRAIAIFTGQVKADLDE